MPAKKLKPVGAWELELLRRFVRERYRADGGVQFEATSYRSQYEDLCKRMRLCIRGKEDSAISPYILCKLYWKSKEARHAKFNLVNLNAFARYITENNKDYDTWIAEVQASRTAASNRSKAIGPDGDPATRALDKDPMPLNAPEQHSPASNERNVSPKSEIATQEKTADEPQPVADARLPNSEAVVDEIGTSSREQTQTPALALLRQFLYAALLAGGLTFIFVLTFPRVSGYDLTEHTALKTRMTSIFGWIVFGHLAIGIVTGLLVRKLSHRVKQPRLSRPLFYLAPLVFIATFFFRQLFVSNGWLIKGRKGAGLFGTPDMETLAHACSFSLCILLLSALVSTASNGSLQVRLLRATIVSLLCSTVFWCISLLHEHLLISGVINAGDFIIAPNVLSLKFPHPERVPLVGFMVFVQTYLTLAFVERRGGQIAARYID